jgi:hypothetical protein
MEVAGQCPEVNWAPNWLSSLQNYHLRYIIGVVMVIGTRNGLIFSNVEIIRCLTDSLDSKS